MGYNDVVTTELTALAGVTQGPDLYTCFLTATSDRFSLFEDSLHPNGLGYALIAALWHDAITGPPVVTGLATCPSSLSAQPEAASRSPTMTTSSALHALFLQPVSDVIPPLHHVMTCPVPPRRVRHSSCAAEAAWPATGRSRSRS